MNERGPWVIVLYINERHHVWLEWPCRWMEFPSRQAANEYKDGLFSRATTQVMTKVEALIRFGVPS